MAYPIIHEAEDFHGFRTVHFYEQECAKAGQQTRRIPCFSIDGTKEAFALLTSCQEPGSAGAYDGLDIITTDEAHCLYSGAVRHDGSDLESTLASAGFLHASCCAVAAPKAETLHSRSAEPDEFSQLAFF